MNIREINQRRLVQQHILGGDCRDSGSLVKWLGAVQAQDYAGAKWALALRMPGTKEADIEHAIASRQIIRTWALRGTWHFLAADDAPWILALMGPRLASIYASYFRKFDLSTRVLAKCYDALNQALAGGSQLTRDELKEALEKKKIHTEGMRLNFILLRSALDQVICGGPRRQKQFTFVSFNEWLPAKAFMPGEEALAELTNRYFSSHGPATMKDFAWWSGLTMAEIKQGLAMASGRLDKRVIDGQSYWMQKDAPLPQIKKGTVYLLPPFDEYLVGYKDRTAAVHSSHIKKIFGAGNGIFSPVIVNNGIVTGTWKRRFIKDKMAIQITPFIPFNKSSQSRLEKAAKLYAGFLGVPIHNGVCLEEL